MYCQHIVFSNILVSMKKISKKQALEFGLKRYFTGKECKRGHLSQRWVCNNICVDCFLLLCKERSLVTSKKHPCVRCGVRTISNFKLCGKCLANGKAWSAKIRKQTIDAYGGKCQCCGECNIKYLTLDHVNGDGGYNHKKQNGSKHRGGVRFYAELRRNNFPKEYPKGSALQVLCANCHLAKSYFGGCGNPDIHGTTIHLIQSTS